MNLRQWVVSSPRRRKAALWALRMSQPLTRPTQAVPRYARFFRDWHTFRERGGKAAVLDMYPCLSDRTATTQIDAQYFHQSVWAARHIARARPPLHVDVGSLALYVGMLTSVVPVVFLDFRPLVLRLPGYTGVHGSVTSLPFKSDSIPSLSCLHVIEHIGLGRYGDPVDPDGHARAAAEMTRVLAPGGRLYLSTPIGEARVQFNGQRVFDTAAITRLFEPLTMEAFSMVDSRGRYHESVADGQEPVDIGGGNDFALGLFVLRKEGSDA